MFRHIATHKENRPNNEDLLPEPILYRHYAQRTLRKLRPYSATNPNLVHT